MAFIDPAVPRVVPLRFIEELVHVSKGKLEIMYCSHDYDLLGASRLRLAGNTTHYSYRTSAIGNGYIGTGIDLFRHYREVRKLSNIFPQLQLTQ